MDKLKSAVSWVNDHAGIDLSGVTADELTSLIERLNEIDEQMVKQDLDFVPEYNCLPSDPEGDEHHD
jgi:hypothetical protein